MWTHTTKIFMHDGLVISACRVLLLLFFPQVWGLHTLVDCRRRWSLPVGLPNGLGSTKVEVGGNTLQALAVVLAEQFFHLMDQCRLFKPPTHQRVLPFIHIWVMGELEPIPGDWARSAVHTCIGQLPIVGRIQTNNHSHLKWPVKCMASFWCLVRVKRQERFKYAQGWICYPFFLTLHRVTCGFPLTNVFTVYMLWGRKDKTLCHDVLRPWIE